jgi:hypothetical protein
MFSITQLQETALTLYYSLFICTSQAYLNNNYKNIKGQLLKCNSLTNNAYIVCIIE